MQFVDFEHITSLFEIYITVLGITSESIGIPIEEIFWKSSFANDLGID
jgi:hypothetical protein